MLALNGTQGIRDVFNLQNIAHVLGYKPFHAVFDDYPDVVAVKGLG
jgi:hypothetical protein